MNNNTKNNKLANKLILNELFDLQLYEGLFNITSGELNKLFEKLIPIEKTHHAFWLTFFDQHERELDVARKIKLFFLLSLSKIFGAPFIHLILEAIEVNGVRDYLLVWQIYKDSTKADEVQKILNDEFVREEKIVNQQVAQKINPTRVRNIFFGFNDGLVEILGAVTGFFAAFGDITSVLIASLLVATAGALSMSAGAYVAIGSENELKKMNVLKEQFLNRSAKLDIKPESELSSTLIVGISYFVGALLPVIPIIFGATSVIPTLVAGGTLIVVVSTILAFLSGMNIKRRILVNLAILTLTITITYAIGSLARNIIGITI